MEDDCDKESTLKVGELLIYRSGTRALRFNGHYVGAPVHRLMLRVNGTWTWVMYHDSGSASSALG
jgi:hypothetical protein